MEEKDSLYEKSKKRKKYSIIAVAMILFLGVGYAYLQTTLNITGTAKVDHNTWNVYWDSSSFAPESSDGIEVMQRPNVDSPTSISYGIGLKKPGDYAEIRVNAKNEGSIDAMIDNIVFTIDGDDEIPDYIDYSITYIDGSYIQEKQLLKSNTSETYKLRIEYKKNVDATDLPGEDQYLDCAFSVTYVQADSTAKVIRPIYYTISDTPVTVGQAIPNGVTTYSTFQEATIAFGQPIAVKHIMLNGKVKESYIVMEAGANLYNFKVTNNNFYEENESEIMRFLGENYCNAYQSGVAWACASSYGVEIKVSTNGNGEIYREVNASNPDPQRHYCTSESGQSRCYMSNS